MEKARPQELKTLTSLRFFAALLVVLTHTMPLWLAGDYNRLPSPIKNVIDAGFVAVPFFFTLSGFVLYYVYGQSSALSQKKQFYGRRFARIAPACFMAIALGICAWANTPGRDAGIIPAVLAHAFFIAAWLPATLFLNFPAWSLSGEVFFYAGYPWIAKGVGRLKIKFILLAMVGIYAFYLFGLMVVFKSWPELRFWPWKYPPPDPSLTLFFQINPFVHLGEFLWGILLARWFELIPSSRLWGDRCLLGGLLLSLATLQFPRVLPYVGLNSFFLLPCFSFIIIGAAGNRGRWLRWLEGPFFIKLGEASFALYIFHMPVRDLVLHSRISSFPILGWFLEGCFCALMIVLSLIIHQVFERPLRSKINQSLRKI